MKPVNNPSDIRIQFTEKYQERLEYEDKLPEGTTEEDIKQEFGKVVWCEYYECFWNKRVKNLQKTWGSIIGNPHYEPIGSNPTDAVFQGICSRPEEIVLRYRSQRDYTGGRTEIPYCFVAGKNGKTGHIDFAKMLQGDGTPFGGNIESNSSGSDVAFH